MNQGLFLTGTDTGVGKTFVAAAIVRRLRAEGVRVGAYKPAVSGCEVSAEGIPVWNDLEVLAEALGNEFPRERICPQRFRAAVAPPVAAREEGTCVDSRRLRTGADWWRGEVDLLIVEGAGGLLSPLSETDTVADVAADLGFPLLIVARLGLGTINHTLLTVEAALRRGLHVAGVLLNEVRPVPDDLSCRSNPGELAARCPVPILGVLPHTPGQDLLAQPAFMRIDFLSLAQRR